MKEIIFSGKGYVAKIVNILVYVVVFIGILFNIQLQEVHATTDDPALYSLQSYDYYPALNVFFANGIPDIFHLDTVSISFEKDSNMDIAVPSEVSDAVANLFYMTGDGKRLYEYQFYDAYHTSIPSPYIWTKSGQYEVDVYGFTSTSTTKVFLATMKFNVVITGGPVPTCILNITPDTIDSKNGESAYMAWSSTNATFATIDQGVGEVATSGSMMISPNATTTYTATFAGPNGSVNCSATVDIPDPIVVPLHEKAAALARTLVNQTEAYLWGGKGWDFDIGEFTTTERILGGYTYYNPDTSSKETGVGVDCSGLITWAFNRSNNPDAGFNNNYIKYVNADGMFRDYQSSPVSEAELQPGDTLSFDWNSDGRMDHVAMYVGESGGYDVVNAGSPAVGIIGRNNINYKLTFGFEGYRRIHQADAPLAITTGSPVDLKVTDPDGNILSATNIIPSDEEYIREIPGEMYYLELTQGHDGRPQDTILAPVAKDGVYVIEVVPEVGADPMATYSLTVEINGVETMVVDNETIDTIPNNGFALKLIGGEIQGLDPTIKVLLGDLYQAISNLTLKSEQRKRNLLSTIESALSWFERNRTDQIIRKLTKLQNDVERHVASELTVEELEDINQQINHLLLLLQS